MHPRHRHNPPSEVALSNHRRRKSSRGSAITTIANVVCSYFKMTLREASINTRKREILQVRQIGMYFCKKKTKATLKAIGDLYEKDHTTVLSSIKTVNNYIETDRNFAEQIEVIDKLF